MSTETEPEILYHYCSNDAFLKIVGGKSIWLSYLSLSNDSEEGKWAKKVFITYCEKRGLSNEDTNSLGAQFDYLIHTIGAVGFSLSERGDTLSQWRGYADNAAGFAIGFSKSYFLARENQTDAQSPKFVVRQLIYDDAEQEKSVAKIADKIISYVKDGALKFPFGSLLNPNCAERVGRIQELYGMMSWSFPMFMDHLYKLKNTAFEEEAEWRLVSIVVKGDSLDDIKEMEFRATHDRIIPYRTLELTKTNIPAIKRVVLGPRNITPIPVIKGFLAKHGHENVEVVPSTASYR